MGYMHFAMNPIDAQYTGEKKRREKNPHYSLNENISFEGIK